MKKLLLCTLLLLHAGTFLMAQTTIVQWDFNTTSSFTVPANGTAPGPSLGSGTINLTGGVTGMNAGGVVPEDGPTPGNRALNTTTYPTQSLSANRKTAGIVISTSTVGYNSVRLTFYYQHSGTAANTIVVQYLTSSIWQDITSYSIGTSGSFLPQKTIDLSGIPALNNNANVQIRLVTDFGNGTNYVGTTGTYASGGTIRYDLITITGNSIGCGTPATQQATGLRLLKTDNSSAQLSLNRGNGAGCLVLCSANNLPNTAPVSGTNYAANSSFGSGPVVGNAFSVYNTQISNPFTQYFNINGLTAGTKYYVAAYEYSSTGFCYLTPGTVDSFYCNSTILYPGDLQFVGYDNNVGSGRDAYVITNLKALKTGTSFQLVNSRYEAGAATNLRTNRWYAGSSDPYQDLEYITLTYKGALLPAGSIISFDHIVNDPRNIKINNANTIDISIIDNLSLANLLSGTAPEQFFLTQGNFTYHGTAGTDRYALLDGHVLHGISYIKDWVDFGQACSGGNTNNDRESRIPPDIKCLKLFFINSDYAYYKGFSSHIGSQGLLLGNIANLIYWQNPVTASTGNNISTIYDSAFTVTSSPSTANWTGSANGNWFNCTNWENLYVPDSTADVTVAAIPTTVAAIDANGTSAAEYNNLATTRSLNITGAVNLSGTSTDKLVVYDVLQTSGTGNLTTSGSVTDTVVVRGGIQNGNAGGLQLSSNGWLALHGNRQLQPINVSLAGSTPVSVNALSLNNPPGVNINSGGFESLNKLELANGILSPDTTTAFHYMGTACTISSPVNYYGETNKGWEKSYIDGKVFIRTNDNNTSYTAPLGSKQKGVFSPLVLRPAFNSLTTYTAGYVGTSHPRTDASDINTPPINKISTQEYWTLTSDPINAAANLTLYYTPLSFVGGQGNDPQALRDLQIVQYWDSSRVSPRKWRLPSFPVSTFTSGPGVQYGKISMNNTFYVTSLNDADKNFTLGSASIINTLPVQITVWAARLQGNRIQLTWQVKQETGTAFYVIEKSTDGRSFHPLQTVYASGLPAYACFDSAPTDGWNYYRLKITDLGGKASYTAIEKVWLKHAATFAVFPNPAAEKVFITLPFTAKGNINLYTPDGKKCMSQPVANTSFSQLTVKGLPTGWYLLEYTDGKNRLTQKLMIK